MPERCSIDEFLSENKTSYESPRYHRIRDQTFGPEMSAFLAFRGRDLSKLGVVSSRGRDPFVSYASRTFSQLTTTYAGNSTLLWSYAYSACLSWLSPEKVCHS